MQFSIIPFLLLFVPILEIAAFIVIGGQIGVLMTLAMILVTAIIGSILLRIQGISILSRIQSESEQGNLPGKDVIHGVMIVVAGILLLTPGFVTDTVGFLLFIPAVRTAIWTWVGSRVTVTAFGSSMHSHPGDHRHPDRPRQEGVIDLDAEDYSEKPNPDTPWGKDGK